jgi:hypothetical protein
MAQAGDIFVHPQLPDAATWFYFSALLAVALFFKFSRLLSMRNLDVLTLFLAAPAILLLIDTPGTWIGYACLFGVSAYFLIRCLVDLSLVGRPALSPNLSLGGLIWLGATLFVGLIVVAATTPVVGGEAAVKNPVPVNKAEQQFDKFGEQVTGRPIADEEDSRAVRVLVGRTLAVVCHLAIVLGLVFVGYWHFQDLHAGVAAATFYLLLPYTYLLLPFTRLQVGQWHHIWPMVLFIWAVAAYRRPTVAGLLLGLATVTVYIPLFTLPVWISFYLRRGLGRFLGAFAFATGLGLAVIGVILWVNGELPRSLQEIWIVADWQLWKELEPGTRGFWTGVKWAPAYRTPVFIAFLAFACTLALWPSPKNLAHLLALSAASLIGIQFWYADQGGIHLFWYLPLLMLLVFRPNLADRRPPVIPPETDWLHRFGRTLGRYAVKLLHLPHPPVHVG